MKQFKVTLFKCAVTVAAVLAASVHVGQAQTAAQPAPDHPSITVQGRTYTPRSILSRNMGTEEDVIRVACRRLWPLGGLHNPLVGSSPASPGRSSRRDTRLNLLRS